MNSKGTSAPIKYKAIAYLYIKEKQQECSLDEIASHINSLFPNGGKTQKRYIKEMLTNRYKGSDTFYTNNTKFGLIEWRKSQVFSKEEGIDIDDKTKEIIEGEIIERKIFSRTRNQTLVKERKKLDKYKCQACNFSYEDKVIACHHLSPLSNCDNPIITNINDLITLCPTCHSIAHILLSESKKYEQPKELICGIQKILNESQYSKKI